MLTTTRSQLAVLNRPTRLVHERFHKERISRLLKYFPILSTKQRV